MNNKKKFDSVKKEEFTLDNDEKTEKVKLKSEMYNHDNELIDRREESSDAIMWGFVLGFILFFILLIIIIAFTN